MRRGRIKKCRGGGVKNIESWGESCNKK